MGNIIKALLLIWELPQNILGMLLYVGCQFSRYFTIEEKEGSIDIYSDIIWGNVSLGHFQFFKFKFFHNNATYVRALYAHSYGHRKQSRALGTLYLPIIFIPSLVWDFLHSHLRILWSKDYYSFYTEKWADKIGGVKR